MRVFGVNRVQGVRGGWACRPQCRQTSPVAHAGKRSGQPALKDEIMCPACLAASLGMILVATATTTSTAMMNNSLNDGVNEREEKRDTTRRREDVHRHTTSATVKKKTIIVR